MLKPRLNDFEVEERSASAAALLADPVVGMALDSLRESYMINLMDAEVGSPESQSAHAGLKILQDFKASLEAMITEKKMRAKYSRSDSNAR
jgi:hypothetical protein